MPNINKKVMWPRIIEAMYEVLVTEYFSDTEETKFPPSMQSENYIHYLACY
jgi:hypothetical protein